MFREYLISLSYFQKRTLQVIADICLLWFALWVAYLLRLGGSDWLIPTPSQRWLFLIAPLVTIPVYIRTGMYRAVMRRFGSQALWGIFCSVTLGFLVFGSVAWIGRVLGWEVLLPRSTFFSFWWLSLLLIGGLRLLMREFFLGNLHLSSLIGVSIRGDAYESGTPVAIYGAGSAGIQLLKSLRVDRQYRPCAFVDDDLHLAGRSIEGLQVYGRDDIGRMIKETGVTEMLLAIPSASRQCRRQILLNLQHYPLRVRTMPGIMDLASGKVKVNELLEVSVDDLLGRDCVAPNPELLEHCIRDQSVMVTGAGGSIGSELCRQIVDLKPAVLVLYEHSEYGLYAIHSELLRWIASRSLDVKLVPILGSIRNSTRLNHVIDTWRVDTVYHAAAYKHVPMVEYNIAEGINNNVFGTLKVAQAAIRGGVKNFVLISTDKAVRPTNVMGASKRLAELVLQGLACESRPLLWNKGQRLSIGNRTRFSMVRFGNVLGSSGSVIPLFRQQLRHGGPVTVTHPEMTRYFMTIPEAAQLVIQAGSMGESGNVYVLDMGEPVSILDMARKMIRLSGLSVRDENNPEGDVEIVFTGLRPGEKLYEELLIGDNPESTQHPRICRANEVKLSWDELLVVLDKLSDAVSRDDLPRVRELLRESVQGYQPQDQEFVDLIYVARHEGSDELDSSEVSSLTERTAAKIMP